MGSRKKHEGADKVYEAAQKWVDCALRADGSLFTPDEAIWTSQGLGELRERFLDQPDVGEGSFYDKLKAQLENSPPEVYQLVGEVLYFHFLIIWPGTMRGDTKEDRIQQVLKWSKQQITIPADLVAALTPGIANIGPGRGRYFPFYVGFIIEFVEQWKELEPDERRRFLAEPSEFNGFATRLDLHGKLFREAPNAHRVQREALLHLVFPDDFEGTVSVEQKKNIADAKAFAHFVTEGTQDVDRKIQQIRRGLEAGLGRDLDFYDPDIRSWWDPSQSDPWDRYVGIASEFLETGRMARWELGYKYDIGRKLAAAREAVLTGTDDWAVRVKRGLIGNLVHFTQLANFRDWIDASPDDARRALRVLWARDDSVLLERVRGFCNLFPRSVTSGAGVRMNVVSQLLMGMNVRRYPPFRIGASDRAYKSTGYDPRPRDADEAALYEHFLGFLDQFIEEARKRGVPVRDRLDAQSLIWIIPFQESETRGKEPPPEDDEAAETMGPSRPHADLQALTEELFLTEPSGVLHEIETLLMEKKQVIFQGPPGTGKTYVAQKLAKHLAGSEERVTLVQLHPSYAYEDFVQGFRPTLKDRQAGFELRDGPLLQAAEKARSDADNNKHFLVIDEINRGNLAKVLGELYFLLEYRDESIRLQYSDEPFSLPGNLYIIGTMNTADRSIALVDLALRRRFYFVEFHPDEEPVKGVLGRWLDANAPGEMEWVANVVERANEKLREDRHAAIGPSYFMKDDLDEEAVTRIWKHSVLPYIEERLFGEGDRLGEFDLDKLMADAAPLDCIVDGLSRLAGFSREEASSRIEAEGGAAQVNISTRWRTWHAAFRAVGLRRITLPKEGRPTLRQVAETNQAFIARVRMHLVTVIDGEAFEACENRTDMDRRPNHYWIMDDNGAENGGE